MADAPMGYREAVEAAAVFDLSGRGKTELTGKDALLFLHNLCTNDVKDLPVGGGCEVFLCTAKAKVVAYLGVSHVREGEREAVWLDCDPGRGSAVLEHLNHFLISEQVELADRTTDLGMLHCCGPQAASMLEHLIGKSAADLAEWQHRTGQLGGLGECHVRRHDLLGPIGFDVFCARDKATQLSQALVAAGGVSASAEAWEVLRIEAGTPVYGQDIHENRAVMEVGRTRQAICYTKGCFLGQEPIVMARDRGHVNRTLLGIKFNEGEAVSAGTKLFKDGMEVGQVTSAVVSPRFGPIALAYVKRGFQEPGTKLQAETAKGGAEVTGRPSTR